MNISRNNYEEYFLDYWENRLDENSKELLMDFIKNNQDLSEEFWSFESIALIPEKNIRINNKSEFKKPEIEKYNNIDESNYPHYFVSLIENELSGKEEKELNQFLTLNPVLVKQLETFKKTKIYPDYNIVFPQKESLKKKAVIKVDFRKTFYWSVTAAASVILMIIAYFILNMGENEKYELVRLIHEKKVDNFRSVALPESYKKTDNIKDENNIARKQIKSQQRNIIVPDNNIKIDEIATIKRIIIENNQPEPETGLFTEMSYQSNIADYINYIKSNEDLKFTGTKNKIDNRNEIDNKRFTFWDIAEAGVKGYNVLTNKKVDFKTEKDKEGKLTYIALGKNFGYSKSKH